MREEAYRNLSAKLRGNVITPGSDEYEAARRVYNGMIDRRPDAIVRCADVVDVVTAVNFARNEDVAVAVRGGGHNGAGFGVCDRGLVIGGLRPRTCDRPLLNERSASQSCHEHYTGRGRLLSG